MFFLARWSFNDDAADRRTAVEVIAPPRHLQVCKRIKFLCFLLPSFSPFFLWIAFVLYRRGGGGGGGGKLVNHEFSCDGNWTLRAGIDRRCPTRRLFLVLLFSQHHPRYCWRGVNEELMVRDFILPIGKWLSKLLVTQNLKWFGATTNVHQNNTMTSHWMPSHI